jgi:hypothetical protein
MPRTTVKSCGSTTYSDIPAQLTAPDFLNRRPPSPLSLELRSQLKIGCWSFPSATATREIPSGSGHKADLPAAPVAAGHLPEGGRGRCGEAEHWWLSKARLTGTDTSFNTQARQATNTFVSVSAIVAIISSSYILVSAVFLSCQKRKRCQGWWEISNPKNDVSVPIYYSLPKFFVYCCCAVLIFSNHL